MTDYQAWAAQAQHLGLTIDVTGVADDQGLDAKIQEALVQNRDEAERLINDYLAAMQQHVPQTNMRSVDRDPRGTAFFQFAGQMVDYRVNNVQLIRQVVDLLLNGQLLQQQNGQLAQQNAQLQAQLTAPSGVDFDALITAMHDQARLEKDLDRHEAKKGPSLLERIGRTFTRSSKQERAKQYADEADTLFRAKKLGDAHRSAHIALLLDSSIPKYYVTHAKIEAHLYAQTPRDREPLGRAMNALRQAIALYKQRYDQNLNDNVKVALQSYDALAGLYRLIGDDSKARVIDAEAELVRVQHDERDFEALVAKVGTRIAEADQNPLASSTWLIYRHAEQMYNDALLQSAALDTFLQTAHAVTLQAGCPPGVDADQFTIMTRVMFPDPAHPNQRDKYIWHDYNALNQRRNQAEQTLKAQYLPLMEKLAEASVAHRNVLIPALQPQLEQFAQQYAQKAIDAGSQNQRMQQIVNGQF